MAELVNEQMQKEVVNAAVATAGRLGIDPRDLLTVVGYETAGSMDPWQAGPITQWGQHRGFAQMGVPQREQYGYSKYDNIAQQMAAVERYLVDNGVKPGMGLLDIYSAVNAGEVGLYDRTDANNGGAAGTVRDKVEQQMEDEKALAGQLMASYARNPSNMNGFQDKRLSLAENANLNGVSKVAQLQEQLASRGYNPGPIDGKMGAQTRAAIAAFQENNGLPPTGKLDEKTETAIVTPTAREAENQSMTDLAAMDRRAAEVAAFNPKDRSTWGTNVAPFPSSPMANAYKDYQQSTQTAQPYADFEQRRAAHLSTLPDPLSVEAMIEQAFAPGNLDRINQAFSAAAQPPVSAGVASNPSQLGGLNYSVPPSKAPSYADTPVPVSERFATFQSPAQNSPEKAYENAVRNSFYDGLASKSAPVASSPFAAQTSKAAFTPSSPFGNGMTKAGGLTPSYPEVARSYPSTASKPSTPAGLGGLSYSVAPASRPSAPAPSLASQYASYGAGTSTTNRAPNDPRAAAYASMPPAPVMASALDRIDIPGSAKPAAPAISPATLANQYAMYGAGKIAPTQTAASTTTARPAAPAITAAPRTVAPRQVTPYTPPAQPQMTEERARALGMVPAVPGMYMPNVPANPAQVMKDQLGLIARSPLAAIGKMIAGTMLGGVFHAGTGLRSMGQNVAQAVGGNQGGLIGALAQGGAMGGVGGSYNGPSGIGYSGGGFQASPGGFGNYGSDNGFNSGLQSGSGFTYDK